MAEVGAFPIFPDLKGKRVLVTGKARNDPVLIAEICKPIRFGLDERLMLHGLQRPVRATGQASSDWLKPLLKAKEPCQYCQKRVT